jgi:integrase
MVSASGSGIRVPSLRLHKASGQAVTTVRGRDIYCGRYGSPESEANYRRVIADLVASGPEVVRHHGLPRSGSRRQAFVPPTARAISVAELLLAYVEFAEREYLPPSRESEIIKVAAKTVRELFGTVPAGEFGLRQLKAVRQKWIDQGRARKYINAKIGRVVRIWQWGAEEELVPASTWHALKSLRGLRYGRSAAKESEPKECVPESDFLAVVPGLAAPVRAILELLWWTGARSGEICSLRTCDIVRDSEPWQYCPTHHKNAH